MERRWNATHSIAALEQVFRNVAHGGAYCVSGQELYLAEALPPLPGPLFPFHSGSGFMCDDMKMREP